MITYNKTDLEINMWYENENCEVLAFKGYRNSLLATFNICKFDEKSEEWTETEEKYYLTSNEVKQLRECF